MKKFLFLLMFVFAFIFSSSLVFSSCGGEESDYGFPNCEPEGIYRCATNSDKNAEVCFEGEWVFFGACEDETKEMRCKFIDEFTEPRCVLVDESRYDIGNTSNSGDSGDSGNSGNTGDSADSGDSGNSGNTGDSGNTGGCISNADCEEDQRCEDSVCRNIFGRSWRIQVHNITVTSKMPNGEDWDAFGGLPDIFVIVEKNSTEVFRTETVDDSLSASWSSAYSSTVLNKSDSLSFLIYDEDVVFDDHISTPHIPSSHLETFLKAGEITEKNFNILSDGVKSFRVTFKGL